MKKLIFLQICFLFSLVSYAQDSDSIAIEELFQTDPFHVDSLILKNYETTSHLKKLIRDSVMQRFYYNKLHNGAQLSAELLFELHLLESKIENKKIALTDIDTVVVNAPYSDDGLQFLPPFYSDSVFYIDSLLALFPQLDILNKSGRLFISSGGPLTAALPPTRNFPPMPSVSAANITIFEKKKNAVIWAAYLNRLEAMCSNCTNFKSFIRAMNANIERDKLRHIALKGKPMSEMDQLDTQIKWTQKSAGLIVQRFGRRL